MTIRNHTKGETYALQTLQNVINFDGADELSSYSQAYGLDFNLFVCKSGAGELNIIDIHG